MPNLLLPQEPGRVPPRPEQTAPSESVTASLRTKRHRISPPRTNPRRLHRRAIGPHHAIGIRPPHAARFIYCSCPIHSGCGHATSIHPRVHPACASSFRCQTTAVFRRSSFDRLAVFRLADAGRGRTSLPRRRTDTSANMGNARQPFRRRYAPGTTRNARTASRLPCRFAAALPRAPTQAPLPDSGI